jgi:hypothetical protein
MNLKYDKNGCAQLNTPTGAVIWDRKESLGNAFPKYVKIFQELRQGTNESSVAIDLIKTADTFLYKFHTKQSVGLRFRWKDDTSVSTIKFLLEKYAELLRDNDISGYTHWVVFTKARVLELVPEYLTKGKTKTQVQAILNDSVSTYYDEKFTDFAATFNKAVVNEFYLFTGTTHF